MANTQQQSRSAHEQLLAPLADLRRDINSQLDRYMLTITRRINSGMIAGSDSHSPGNYLSEVRRAAGKKGAAARKTKGQQPNQPQGQQQQGKSATAKTRTAGSSS
jgi:hypothetical protein